MNDRRSVDKAPIVVSHTFWVISRNGSNNGSKGEGYGRKEKEGEKVYGCTQVHIEE